MKENSAYIDRRLKNGVRVVGERLPGFRSVSVGIWVRAGSVTEWDETNGYSHLIEHMLFKGTEKRSAKQIAVEMDNMGGQLNAFTAKECTCYYAKVMDEKLEQAVEILCDMFCHSAFAPEELAKEKGVVLEEISMFYDTPDDVAHETIAQTFFEGTPLARTILGPAKNIQDAPRERILEYLSGFYTADRIIVAVAGNFEEEALMDALEKGLSKIRPAADRDAGFDYSAFVPPHRLALVDKDIEQVHVSLGLPGYSLEDPDKYAFSLLCNLLGGSMSSRLFQKIREEMGMAYSVFSYTSCYTGTGMLGLYAGTSKENAAKVMETMAQEFALLRRERITAEELAQGKEQLRGNFVLAQESTSSRMNALGKHVLLSGRIVPDEEVLSRLANVSMEQMDRVIDRVFDESRMSGAVVGRPAHADRIQSLFR